MFSSCLASLVLLAAAPAPVADLQALYLQNRFFELRDALAETPPSGAEADFYQGIVANRFGAYEASENALNRYLSQTGPLRNRQSAQIALADSAVKLSRYKQAADLYDKMILEFGEEMNPKDAADYRNVGGMWRALADIPPQEVKVAGDSTVTSQAGVIRSWPVQIGDKTQGMLLDTGANFSVIRKSLAELYGFKLVQSNVMVTGITGAQTPAVLGVAPELKLGSATIKNAVFLVFEDKALNVGGGLQLDGIVGYPIISALGRVTFTRSGDLLISTASPTEGKSNLCIDGFSMMVEGRREGQRLVFQLDTGANRTALYPSFLAKFGDWIKKEGKEVSDRFGGVGGVKVVPAYEVSSLTMEIGGKQVILPKTRVHRELSSGRSGEVDGNLGVDLISQFEKMTLDFRAMQLVFE